MIALDGHVDTVGVGDPSTWTRDPYQGELKDGIVFGRGAGDQEAGVAAAVYGARIVKELGLADDVQLWVTGTVMEEDCDGLCWQYILRETGAAARRRRDHRADQPRRVPRPPRAHGDRSAHAGPLLPRLGARARHQRGLPDGADRRGHRAPERAAGRRRPIRSSARAPSPSPTSARRRRRCAPWPTAARSTSTGDSRTATPSSRRSPRSRRSRA